MIPRATTSVARVALSRSMNRLVASPGITALRRPTTFIRNNHNVPPPQNNDPNWPSVASDVVWWTGIVGLAYVVTHPFL